MSLASVIMAVNRDGSPLAGLRFHGSTTSRECGTSFGTRRQLTTALSGRVLVIQEHIRFGSPGLSLAPLAALCSVSTIGAVRHQRYATACVVLQPHPIRVNIRSGRCGFSVGLRPHLDRSPHQGGARAERGYHHLWGMRVNSPAGSVVNSAVDLAVPIPNMHRRVSVKWASDRTPNPSRELEARASGKLVTLAVDEAIRRPASTPGATAT